MLRNRNQSNKNGLSDNGTNQSSNTNVFQLRNIDHCIDDAQERQQLVIDENVIPCIESNDKKVRYCWKNVYALLLTK